MGGSVKRPVRFLAKRSDRDLDKTITPTRPFEPLEPYRDEPRTDRSDTDFNEGRRDNDRRDDE